jgi:hypothetical protein
VLLHGPSGFGKTLWARAASAELARAGHVPIWLAADVCEDSFRTSTARAIAPYTSLSPDELLRAAEAAGRGVVFVVDDLTKASAPVQQALLDGAKAVRLRNPSRGLLITAQPADVASSVPDCLDVELTVPDDAERRAVLGAYGAPEIIDRCDAFVTPLELSLAASYAGELAPGANAAELLDRHVDRVAGGDDRLRGGLRVIAGRMHTDLRPSLPRPDVARTTRRDHGFTDADLQGVFGCPIVAVAPGRVSFRHERFEYFLAAEALLLDTRAVQALAGALNTPRCADLREDVVALESQEDRLTEILSVCEHADVALVHHSDRGSQYTSIDYTQTLTDHGVLASVGSVGDAHDNALAESFVDSVKTELIADRVWRTRSQLELAFVEYLGWFNHDRLHQALADRPPVEFEQHHAVDVSLRSPSGLAALDIDTDQPDPITLTATTLQPN